MAINEEIDGVKPPRSISRIVRERETYAGSVLLLIMAGFIYFSLTNLNYGFDYKYIALFAVGGILMDKYAAIKPTFDSDFRVYLDDIICVAALFILNPLGLMISQIISTGISALMRHLKFSDIIFNITTLGYSAFVMASVVHAPIETFELSTFGIICLSLVALNMSAGFGFALYGEYAEIKAIFWSKPEVIVKMSALVFGIPLGYSLTDNKWMVAFVVIIFIASINIYQRLEVLLGERNNLLDLADTLDSTSKFESLEEIEEKILDMARRYINADSVEITDVEPTKDQIAVLLYEQLDIKKWLVVNRKLKTEKDWKYERYVQNMTTVASIAKRAVENNSLKEQLRNAAQIDMLTGLHNRRSLESVLEREMAAVRRGKVVITVLFIDLNLFKPINDKYGHAQGDYVLKVTASRINETVRQEDFVARIGGDEFVIVCRDQDDEMINALATRLKDAVSKNISIKDVNKVNVLLNVSASIGISKSSEEICTTDLILNSADKAMYEVKESTKKQNSKLA